MIFRLSALSASFVLFIVLTGCFFLPRETLDERPALLASPEERITYVKVFRGPIERIVKQWAVAESVQEEYLYFKQDGRIATVFVQYGDEVTKGMPLIKLDEGNMEYKLMISELEVERSRIFLETAKIEAEFGEYSPMDIRLKEIDLEISELQLKKLKKTYAERTLQALFEGRITSIKAEEGNYVSAYEDLIRISNHKKIHLVINVADTELLEILQPGVDLEFEIKKDKWLPGRVTHVPRIHDRDEDQKPDRKVLISLEDQTVPLELNKMYKVIIIAEKNDNAVQVSKDGVRDFFGTKTARVKNQETGVVNERELELGIEGEASWEVLDGLIEGDMVIAK